jgi:hypothetical protein
MSFHLFVINWFVYNFNGFSSIILLIIRLSSIEIEMVKLGYNYYININFKV